MKLKLPLFDRAADLINHINRTTLVSDDGIKAIVAVLYKRKPLSVVINDIGGYNTLINTRSGNK